MKHLLAVFVVVALSATSSDASQTVSAHYVLLHPSATIETDFSGRCERIRNVSDGVVYLPLLSGNDFDVALRAVGPQLDVEDCKAQ